MKQVNLMEHLKKVDVKTPKINIGNTYIQEKQLTNTEKRKLCNEYLIPLLSKYFIDKKSAIGDIFKYMNNDEEILKEIKQMESLFINFEKLKTFLYQTCLNFVEEYSDFILTPKLRNQTKEELIIKAFVCSDFGNRLLNVNRGYENAENGCYVSIDLHEISK